MAYKYLKASSMALTPESQSDLKDQYIGLFQETLNDQFYNSSDVWTIEEETSNGSAVYADIDVRVNTLINAETGLKLGDDWKRILFKDIDHLVELGRLFIFDGSTWLTINTEFIKNLAGSSAIRRCNNTLRWIDEDTGAYYEEPCCIEYLVKEARNYFTTGSPFPTPGGFLHIITQFNERTNLINENQRFLFGNPEHWTCYKTVGTGINDFSNLTTYDIESARILTLDLIADFVNEQLDDVINGIADVNTNLYTITLDKDSVEGAPGNTIQLLTTVTYNRDSVIRNITWATSNPAIATVSTTGVVTFVALGTCTITATIEGNPLTDTCSVVVTNSPAVNTYIVITPNENYILEDDIKTYHVYLYENNAIQADSFTITCNRHSVPSTSYTFTTIDGNSFSISNILRDVDSYLTISCVSGTYTKTIDLYLRGAWQNDNIPYA